MSTAEHRPGAKSSEDILWNICIKAGIKHNLTPQDVIKKLIVFSEKAVLIEEGGLGQVIWRKLDGSEVEMKVFGNHGNENTNNPST